MIEKIENIIYMLVLNDWMPEFQKIWDVKLKKLNLWVIGNTDEPNLHTGTTLVIFFKSVSHKCTALHWSCWTHWYFVVTMKSNCYTVNMWLWVTSCLVIPFLSCFNKTNCSKFASICHYLLLVLTKQNSCEKLSEQWHNVNYHK